METNKKRGSVVAIVILSILVVVLGGYIVYDKIITKDNNEVIDKKEQDNKSKDEKNVEYVFDQNNIYNKRSSWTYTIIDKSIDTNFVKETENGYIVSDPTYNISYEITKKYKTYLEAAIFTGGPDMFNYRAIFLNEDGTLEYLKYVVVGNDQKGNEEYGFRSYKINNLKDVEKFYFVELAITKDNETNKIGQSVIAQTKDGTLYDLCDYVGLA